MDKCKECNNKITISHIAQKHGLCVDCAQGIANRLKYKVDTEFTAEEMAMTLVSILMINFESNEEKIEAALDLTLNNLRASDQYEVQ
jgi:hypothetical protein